MFNSIHGRFLSNSLWLVLLCLISTAGLANTKPLISDAECLECHAKADTAPTKPVDSQGLTDSVHAELGCLDCHTEIVDAQKEHEEGAGQPLQDCRSCHQKQLQEAKRRGSIQLSHQLVIDNAEAYDRTPHAKEIKDQPGRLNATCEDCHSSHTFAVPQDKKSDPYDEWRLGVPALCAQCHEDVKEKFDQSVHGVNLIEYENAEAAICIDCHTSHSIELTESQNFKLLLPEECGDCHAGNLRTYRDTYHGQTNKLGNTETAKCYDCHGSHDIQYVEEEGSKVHPSNLLETCSSCHDGEQANKATPMMMSYGPHANADDFERYPEVWIATKFMLALLIGVFVFFWTHSILWYVREWQASREPQKRIKLDKMELQETRHFLRFEAHWRIGHLLFALVTMLLILTGTTLMYAETDWAPIVVSLMGGTSVAGLIHRISAALFLGIFLIHFIHVMVKLLRSPDFRWFGPDSLIPRWKDIADCRDMFLWFFGKGEKPLFDRWTYYEKFDYWAVFWGVSVIGASGLMLAFPQITASYMPGWVFNVATIVHGEEAFLAAVFLFTVHFFNNHFRPDKLPPPDIVMFTGTQSLEEFRRDHTAQYLRLKERGELERHLVEAPSSSMTLGSILLGAVLILFGIVLLVLVLNGYLSGI